MMYSVFWIVEKVLGSSLLVWVFFCDGLVFHMGHLLLLTYE